MEGKLDRAKGSMKEKTGRATDDRSLEEEGKRDQAKGKAKESLEKAKDAARDLRW